jgi:hypothetical protein
VGAAAASASAAGDSWGDPAVTLLESLEDSLADPIVKLLHFPEDSLGNPVGRSLLCCSFDPRIHWATPSCRYSAAVLTRGFIGLILSGRYVAAVVGRGFIGRHKSLRCR